MYTPFNQPGVATQKVAGATGAAQPSEGGLTLAPLPSTDQFQVTLPPRLHDKLMSIRLLSSVPLSYMVPDASMLPPESIRFFFVDQTWVDRVIDGVLAAANTGSVDITFSCALNQQIRATLDAELQATADQQVQSITGGPDLTNWDPSKQPMTGMLIRSDIVRRWPNIGITAFISNGNVQQYSPVAVLRAEAISQGIYIALFAGTPDLVQVWEPHVGLRFGVMVTDENTPQDGNYHVDPRDVTGKPIASGGPIQVPLRSAAWRALNVSQFAANVKTATGQATVGSRLVAMELERQRWVQDFGDKVPESDGLKQVLHIGPIRPIGTVVSPVTNPVVVLGGKK